MNRIERNGVKMNLYIHIIILLIFISLTESKGCPESLATLSIVSKCPLDSESWNTAATRKHCRSVAQIQKCSKPKDFVYHCLVNNWGNATVEVCAPTWFINGYCAEFNIPEARILNNIRRDCTSSPMHCPTRYISSDAYKYPGCYDLISSTSSPKTKTGRCKCLKEKCVSKIELIEGQKMECTESTETNLLTLLTLALFSPVLFMCILGICLYNVLCRRSEESYRQQLKDCQGAEAELPLLRTSSSYACNTDTTDTKHVYSEATGGDNEYSTGKCILNSKKKEDQVTSFRSNIYSDLEKSNIYNVFETSNLYSDLEGGRSRGIHCREMKPIPRQSFRKKNIPKNKKEIKSGHTTIPVYTM